MFLSSNFRLTILEGLLGFRSGLTNTCLLGPMGLGTTLLLATWVRTLGNRTIANRRLFKRRGYYGLCECLLLTV